jgi:2-polyprenyl-3-methyl-5-hydroxy-6-metoxy-1,4-benzoquinol methylase
MPKMASIVKLEDITCPIGCVASDKTVLTSRDRLHDLPGKYTLVRCNGCGLMRTSPRPTAETIGSYYPEDYGPYRGTQVSETELKGLSSRKKWITAIIKSIFDTKAHSIPKIATGRMLEIGCASGSFLHQMAQNGWDVSGIEFSPEAASAARSLGYSVETGTVESIEKPLAYYDLIVGWMVVEHLHKPVECLQKLLKWTDTKGWLAISVPDAGAFEFRLFGPRWYALQVPTHLFHYTPTSIRRILAAGGWQVVKIQRHRTLANFIASFGYWLFDKGFKKIGKLLIDFPERGGRLGALLLFPFSIVMASIGQTGRMTVWAQPIVH